MFIRIKRPEKEKDFSKYHRRVNRILSYKKRQVVIHRAFWLLPLFILFISYSYLAYELDTPFLFYAHIHESGRYTLLETIFYFDHFIREILVSVLTAFIVAISFYLFSPLPLRDFRRMMSITKYTIPCLLFFLIVVIAGALLKNGFHSFLLDLLQFRTRDNLVSYGSHWHSHLLHIQFIFFTSLAVSFMYRGITHTKSTIMNKGGITFLIIWQAVIILLTLTFIPDIKPFTDTRYLAHQFREIITHISVTMPLAFAFLIAIEYKSPASQVSHNVSAFKKIGFLLFIGCLAIPLYILIQLSGRNIMAEAQTKTNYFNLLASHYFEHSLDYVFVPLLTATIFIVLVTTLKRRND
jgi:hypothetical protein